MTSRPIPNPHHIADQVMQARVLKLYAAHEEAGLAEAGGEEAAGAEALAPHADHDDPADAQVRASPDHPPRPLTLTRPLPRPRPRPPPRIRRAWSTPRH